MTDTDLIHEHVAAQRVELADLLARLDEQQWAAASLCAGWTVHDVAAHLTLATRVPIPLLVRSAIRARGDFDRMMDLLTRGWAARFTHGELVAQLRETADSRRRPPGTSPADPLVDVLVHGQDITRPLGLPHEMPVAAAVAALDHVVDARFYGRRTAGTTLVATDAGWTAGAGPEVHGTAADLLLVATGRPAALPGLTGPGATRLAATLSPSGSTPRS